MKAYSFPFDCRTAIHVQFETDTVTVEHIACAIEFLGLMRRHRRKIRVRGAARRSFVGKTRH